MTKPKLLQCSICDHPIQPEIYSGWRNGHNAQPVNDGRCCAVCNWEIVIPARLKKLYGDANILLPPLFDSH
jgi:hypothetical protein